MSIDYIIRSTKFKYKSSMTAIMLALNDGVEARSETVRRLACSSTLRRLHGVRSIFKLWENIRCCVEAEVRIVVVSCTRRAHPGSIARSETKVEAHYCCHHMIHILHTLATSTMCCNPMESSLHFLKVQLNLANKYNLSSFVIFLLLQTSKAVCRMVLLAGSSTDMTNAFPISFTNHRHLTPYNSWYVYRKK
jgi:hypothetical protein